MKSNFQVVDTNSKIWSDTFKKLKPELKDIFYNPKFIEILSKHSNNKKEKIKCAIYTEKKNLIIYPFLVRNLNTLIKPAFYRNYKDTTGIYGRNWIINSNNIKKEIIIKFESKLKDFFLKNKIICSFDRAHPFINNDTFFKKKITKSVGKFFFIDLKKDLKVIFAEFKKSLRKEIKKAQKNKNIKFGYIKNSAEIQQFFTIYTKTMKNKNAKKFYFFKRNFFLDIFSKFKNSCKFYYIKKKNRLLSVELVLYHKKYAHSYLGGTTEIGKGHYANQLLKYKIITDLKDKKIEYYLLGAGQKIDDGVAKYKEGFSNTSFKNSRIFFNIWDNKIFYKLKKDFKINDLQFKNKFQFYES